MSRGHARNSEHCGTSNERRGVAGRLRYGRALELRRQRIDRLVCARFREPRTVAAVAREIRRGRTEGYAFVGRAIDALGTRITVVDADEATVERFSEHVDTGEAEALAAAVQLDRIVVTDDMAACELARKNNISFTGSVGITADGVRRGELDVETADRWLSEWIRVAGYHSPIESVTELL